MDEESWGPGGGSKFLINIYIKVGTLESQYSTIINYHAFFFIPSLLFATVYSD